MQQTLQVQWQIKNSSQENTTESEALGIYLTKGPKLSREHGKRIQLYIAMWQTDLTQCQKKKNIKI